ncbi:MAG: MotE family protein [Syntrophales bacterium]|jgi:flagellar motility protein MotE (MotC chaperone)
MKKIIITIEILVLFLFIVKIIAIGEIVKRSEISDYLLWSVKSALADSSSQASVDSPSRDVSIDTLASERNLMSTLADRRRQLENRENLVKLEEKKINLLRNEIVARIEMVRGREEKMTSPQESARPEDSTRFKELAKAYEATPPDKVGALLNKMDSKTAAGIIMQMKVKKAGAVWGQLDPEKAVEITKAIARI